MRVLLCNPKEKSMFGDDIDLPDGIGGSSGHPNLGLAALSSYLKQKGIQIRVYDHQIENSQNKLNQIITEFQPDVIGLTSFSYSYIHAIDLVDIIKTMTKAPVILGGPHVSATKAEVFENSKVDFAVKGEGEITFEEFLHEIQKPEPNYSEIQGLLWRNENGEVIENCSRPFIYDLDPFPYPDFEAFPLKKYACFQTRTLPIISSRGCPYACTFCSVVLTQGRNFRKRTPKNFVDELEYWNNKGWERFEIDDDCYSCDMKRCIKISKEILNRGLKVKYDIYNGIRVDRVSPEMLSALRKSGCSLVSFGLESANLQILKNIKKDLKSLDQVTDAVKWARDAGLKTSVNFIIGHQGETIETARESLRFGDKLDADFVNFYNLVPYPGTETYEWVKKNARMLVPEEDYLRHISYRDNEPIFETDDFSAEERRQIIREGFKLYEKKVLKFRLGKILGMLAYFPLRFKPLGNWLKKAVNQQGVVRRSFIYLSQSSRQ